MVFALSTAKHSLALTCLLSSKPGQERRQHFPRHSGRTWLTERLRATEIAPGSGRCACREPYALQFSREYSRLFGAPLLRDIKNLHLISGIVPGSGYVDLYERVNTIPFEEVTSFFANT